MLRDFDRRAGVGLVSNFQALFLPKQSALDFVTYSLGVAWSYESRFSVSVPHGWFQEGIAIDSVIGPRMDIEAGLALRVGYFAFSAEEAEMPILGSLQLPAGVRLSYKPWPLITLGAALGGGAEFFAWRPVRQYTGVRADTVTPSSSIRPFVEGGLHAGLCW